MVYSGADIQEALPHFSPHSSVFKLMLEALKRNGDKEYQVDGQTGYSETFAKFMQNSCSIAVNLSLRGVTEGNFVVMCCDKSSAAFSVLLATWFTGATAVLINPLEVEDICSLTNDCPVKIVFCNTLYRDSVAKSVKHMSVEPDIITIEEIIKSLMTSSEEFKIFEVKDVKKHIPLILFTSGSTSGPKGVLISDLALQYNGYNCEGESTKRYLMISNFSWGTCISRFVGSILRGYTLILTSSKEPKEHLELIQKYRVNIWFFHSATIDNYTQEYSRSEKDLTSLTDVIIGGEVIMPRETEAFIMKVLQGKVGVKNLYGMTELGIATTWKGKDVLNSTKRRSCGNLAPGVQLKVTDEAGTEVRTGDPGLLWIKSLSLMNGYWYRPELNNERIDEDGFFRTGDIGYIDEEGFLFVKGRTSDLKDINGFQISISEIEDILKSHSDILDAAVVVKPGSCELGAFAVKVSGSHVTEEHLISFTEEHIKKVKPLGCVHFIDKVPKNYNIKVDRKLLQRMLLQM